MRFTDHDASNADDLRAARGNHALVLEEVVAVDGLPMYDVQQGTRRLKDVLSTMPVKEEHRFSVRRAINTAVTLD